MGFFSRLTGRDRVDASENDEIETDSAFIRAKDVGPKPAIHVESRGYQEIYDGGDGSFSLAIGTWKPDERLMLPAKKFRTVFIRWNGPSEAESGIPLTKQPDWFPLPPELAVTVLDNLADRNFEYWASLLEAVE